MKFFPDPWSKETPWGLTNREASTFAVLAAELKQGGEAGAYFIHGEGGDVLTTLITRGFIEEVSDPRQGGDVVIRYTTRGQAVLEGLRLLATCPPKKRDDEFFAKLAATLRDYAATFPDDGRSYDEITQRLLDLQARQRELEPEITEARRVLIPVLANHAKQQVGA